MSTRRRIGVSVATTEAARRALIKPVPCWKKQWVVADGASIKVCKWVKTDAIPQFSDDEDDEADVPLAPLPDEQEGDVEAEENLQEALEAGVVEPSAAPSTLGTENGTSDPALLSVNQAPTPDGLPSPAGLSLQQSAPETAAATPDVIGDLEPLTMEVDAPDGVGTVTLDMSTIGPDGINFESGDMTQMEGGTDALLGGVVMDRLTTDPFAMPDAEHTG